MDHDRPNSLDRVSTDRTITGTPPTDLRELTWKDTIEEVRKSTDVVERTPSIKDELTPPPSQIPNTESSLKIYSRLRKYSLLGVFCFAQFLDIFNLSAVFAALPTIANSLHMNSNEPVWTVSALQLTFSAFLLVSGRICDVYTAKYSFIVGTAGVGIFCLGTGFVHSKIALFILRALNGIASSLTIPAALNLIVKVFPVPQEQSIAIAIFGAVGAFANVMGILIGALFVQFVTWRWVFWFAAIVGLSIAAVSIFLIPPEHELRNKSGASALLGEFGKLKGLDLVGVSILTVALVLFIFSVVSGSSTSGSDSNSWGKGKVIAPLVISIILVITFFVYETKIPEDRASIPPSLWFQPNFAVLFGAALYPFFWGSTNLLVFLQYWEDVFGWSVVGSAARTVPCGVSMALTLVATMGLVNKFSHKWFILTGFVLDVISGLIFPFAGRRDQYWPRIFPAFVIGTSGLMLIYVHTNIAMFKVTSPNMAGTVGAIFNSALQLGAAVGVAVTTSIASSIESKTLDGKNEYKGRKDAFWFVFAIICVETISVLVFYKPEKTRAIVETNSNDIEKGGHISDNKKDVNSDV